MISKSSDESPSTSEGWRKLGNEQLERGAIEDAVSSYTNSIELKPEDSVAWSNRSAANALAGKLEEALSDAQQCVKLSPHWAKAHFRVAKALEGLHRYQDAIAELEAAKDSCEDPEGMLTGALESCRENMKRQLLIGRWRGKVTEKLGGYQQIMEFFDNGDMRVAVMAKAQDAAYKLDTTADPMVLHIDLAPDHPMRKDDNSNAVSYIVRFPDEDTLDMCCPYLTNDLPKTFDGPGFVRMDRINKGEKIDKKDEQRIEAPELEELKGLSDRDIMLKYVREFCEVLKSAAKEGDKEFQVPEAKDEKTQESNKEMLKMLAINVKVNALEQKYGSDVTQAGFLLAAQQEEKRLDDREMDRAVMELRLRMLQTGIINEDYLKEARETLKDPSLVTPSQLDGAPVVVESAASSSTARGRLQKKLDERNKSSNASNGDGNEGKSTPEEPNTGGKSRRKRHNRHGKKKVTTPPAEKADTTPAEKADTTPAEKADTTPAEKADTATPAETASSTPEPESEGDVCVGREVSPSRTDDVIIEAAAEFTEDTHNTESLEGVAREEKKLDTIESEAAMEYGKEKMKDDVVTPSTHENREVEVAEADVTPPHGGEEIRFSSFSEVDVPSVDEAAEEAAEMAVEGRDHPSRGGVTEVTVVDAGASSGMIHRHASEEARSERRLSNGVPITPTMLSAEAPTPVNDVGEVEFPQLPLLTEPVGRVPVTPTLHTGDIDGVSETSEVSVDPATAHGVPLTPTEKVSYEEEEISPLRPSSSWRWSNEDLYFGAGLIVGGIAVFGITLSLLKRSNAAGH
ncbi:hypothetical protein FOL46_009011 [Perkinsus olseni]|uniref:Uncharacterized protein n=1 Tax=Perkinsus olseni TaxID=32597 RepID=A0A7J6L3U3_PEROL|nr:hypothetical protein FOL46_009011 [Perkinsus olseni]